MTKKKKYNYKDLDLIIERSKLKNQIFQPSSFWSKASKKIKNELMKSSLSDVVSEMSAVLIIAWMI